MRCLCCQEEVKAGSRYHSSCLRRLFNVSWAPIIPYEISDLPMEVGKVAVKMSISGAQIKASVRLNAATRKLEIVGDGGTHIMKPEPSEFPELPQSENLCMNIAEKLGMEVPPHGLFAMKDMKLCYIIRRFDRGPEGEKIHKEDMAQILSMATEKKYDSSLEAVGKAILKFSKNKYLEAVNFFERVVLCFIIGNGDMHLKNWSLIRPADEQIRLAPCYDLVSSSIYLNDEESALTLNGKRNKLRITDFLALAEHLKIDQKAAKNSLERMVGSKTLIVHLIGISEMSEGRKKRMIELVESRCGRLSG